MSARCGEGDSRLIHRVPDPMDAGGQRYARLGASICAARASACVSIYSRMFVSLPSRTVMSKTQSSSKVLFVALTFPFAKPATRTRSPCATNSRGSVDVAIDLDAVSSKSVTPSCPRCVPASGQSSPGMIHLMSSVTRASRASLSPRPIAAKKSFTVWMFVSILMGISPFRSDRIALDPIACFVSSCSSVELDEILEDQVAPAVSARLHKQPAFRKPAELDRREAESFRKLANRRCGSVIVARQEHDSPATMDGRILGKDGSTQMVEALDQSTASKGLREGLGRRLSPEFLRRHAVGVGDIDDGLALPRRQRLRDILVRLETDRQKDDVRLDGVRQFFGSDRGSDRGRGGCKA